MATGFHVRQEGHEVTSLKVLPSACFLSVVAFFGVVRGHGQMKTRSLDPGVRTAGFDGMSAGVRVG